MTTRSDSAPSRRDEPGGDVPTSAGALPESSRDSLARVAWLGGAAFCFALPFFSLGRLVLTVHGIWWGDGLAALFAPFWLLRVVHHRRALAKEPLLWAITGWALVQGLSSALHGEGWLDGLKSLQWLVVIWSFAALSRDGRTPQLLRALVSGGVLALVLGLVGYGLDASGILPDLGFAFRSLHPLVPFPRLVGTFRESPEHMGEFLVVYLVVVLLSELRSRARVALFMLGGVTLALTFSFSWVGAFVLAGAASVHRLRRGLLVASGAVLFLALSWVMNFSLPGPVIVESTPCAQIDLSHHVTTVSPGPHPQCIEHGQRWPYAAPKTLYGEAKLFALTLIAQHPLFGVGPEGFRERMQQRSERPDGSRIGHYVSPHSTYLGALVDAGLFGGLALAAMLWALVARRPDRRDAVGFLLFWAVVAILVIGFNIDVLRQRHLWVLLGLVAARTRT